MGSLAIPFSALTALLVGSALQPLTYRLMMSKAVFDVPSGRSSHTVTTPRGGGVAIVAAIACALMYNEAARVLAIPLFIYAAIGLLEDMRGVSVSRRLSMQLCAGSIGAVVLVPAKYSVPIYVIGVLCIAVWLLAYANIFNFMDGLNGISAAHAILGGAVYAIVGWTQHLPVLLCSGVAVAAASATFLPWNAGNARIFLGDVGSYGLGGFLGIAAAYGVLHGVRIETMVAPLALYIADTGWTLLKRWRRGDAWHLPHRTHAYQRLTDYYWSHQRVTIVTALVGLVVSLCGFASLHASGPHRIALDLLSISILGGYLASPAVLARRRGDLPARKSWRAPQAGGTTSPSAQ